MQLNNKLYYYEITNAREQSLVWVDINGDKDLTDILDKMRKKESESEYMREEERALLWKILFKPMFKRNELLLPQRLLLLLLQRLIEVERTSSKLKYSKYNWPLILCQYMIALSSSAEAPPSWWILKWTMLVWKSAHPITIQRYVSADIAKSNGLLWQYAAIIKHTPEYVQAKKQKKPVTMIL